MFDNQKVFIFTENALNILWYEKDYSDDSGRDLRHERGVGLQKA